MKSTVQYRGRHRPHRAALAVAWRWKVEGGRWRQVVEECYSEAQRAAGVSVCSVSVCSVQCVERRCLPPHSRSNLSTRRQARLPPLRGGVTAVARWGAGLLTGTRGGGGGDSTQLHMLTSAQVCEFAVQPRQYMESLRTPSDAASDTVSLACLWTFWTGCMK